MNGSPVLLFKGRTAGLLAGARFLKWRALARLGYDPHGQIRSVSLWRGFWEHYRVTRMTPEQRHAYRNRQAYLALLKSQRRYRP